MATVTKQFDSYRVFYYSQNPNLYEGLITCVQAGEIVGRMVFYPDGAALPPNPQPTTTISLNFHMSRWANIMATLLHEKPLHLVFYTDTSHGYLSTTQYEPTGEEEPV